jgi:dCMP deaminase
MTKDTFYLSIAREVSKASKCLRSNFGAVVVRNDMIIGCGFNGPARGVKHCDVCKRAEFDHGCGYEHCNAVHAEVNAIIQSGGRAGCLGATMYMGSHNKKYDGTRYNAGMGDFPCNTCARAIVNAGIEWLIQEEEGGKIVRYNIPKLVREGKII